MKPVTVSVTVPHRRDDVFRFEWLAAPTAERLAVPLTRAVIRRGNMRSLRRLAEQLDRRAG